MYFDRYFEYVNPGLHTLPWRYTNYNSDFRELQLCINLSDTPPSVVHCGKASDGKRFASLQCEHTVMMENQTKKRKGGADKNTSILLDKVLPIEKRLVYFTQSNKYI